ncbi:MAG TPA: hypothetical protein DCQ28_00170 [Bacteroidetes bacterium]|nr:hypothetical protein [Bacteroidota bacterium]
MNMKFLSVIIFSVMFFIAACDDQGDPIAAVVTPPTLLSIVPDSGAVGDTVTIIGKKFGSVQGSSSIRFGSIGVSAIVSWSDSSVRVKVPANTSTGNVTVMVNGVSSAGKNFKVLGTVSAISFINDIRPLITSYNCAGCHPSSGGFSVATHTTILTRVTVGNGEGSLIIKKLRGTSGTRMPQGGPFMSNSEIQKFVEWINQGAQNN